LIDKIIEKELIDMNGRFSIVLKDLKKGEILYSLDAERLVPSASTIKVLILVDAMKQILKGKADLKEKIPVRKCDKVDFSLVTLMDCEEYSISDLLMLMISISDNTATNLIIERLGMAEINKTAEILALTDTKLQRKMMDFEAATKGKENLTSPRDMVKLLEMIYHREILTPEACDKIIRIMSTAVTKEFMTRYLPADLKVAHKTGELDGINHDVGIVFSDAGDYLLGIFATGLRDNIDGREYIARLSGLIYDYLVRHGRN
jgi:beta-lactamase class A